MKKFKYAIIGKGFIFSRHVQAVEDTGGEVIVTCDIDPKKEADFLDYREMFDSKIMNDVDVVVICTPNHLHAEMVRGALHIGKTVLCEKPLTINTDFNGLEGVNVVQQLHYHPLFETICEKLKKAKKVKTVLRAYRDKEYWDSWKGDEAKSGGVVYVLGAHMFDLLVHALGSDFKIEEAFDNVRTSKGMIKFGDTEVEYDFEFLDSRKGQTRHLEIDGEKYVLSLRDNLSFEGLHDKVYVALHNGESRKINDIIPSINLMDTIKKVG